MGGSNFGASFAAAYGGRILTKKSSQVLFTLFVILGALSIGRPVVHTLSNKIIPSELINVSTLIIILASATVSIFIANLLGVPQSTSLVTVGSLLGVGLYFGHVYTKTFFYLIPFWVGLPIIGYVLTYLLGKIIYPPRKSNFWIYEKLVNQRERLKKFVIIASCYNAFSVGTNNVANAVGPMVGAGVIGGAVGLGVTAPLFGVGSFIFHNHLKTTGQKIVPLGILTATIICFVTGTLMIMASIFGVPQSFVMIKVACVFAIGGLKNGHKLTFGNPVTKKNIFNLDCNADNSNSYFIFIDGSQICSI